MDLAGSICDDALCGAMFYAIFVGPFILAGAVVGTVIVRAIARGRGASMGPLPTFITYIVLVVILIPTSFGVRALNEYSHAQERYAEGIRSIDFQTFWPTRLPEGFEVSGVTASASASVYFSQGGMIITYDTPIGPMQAFQSPAADGIDDPGPDDCRDDDRDESDTIAIGSSSSGCRVLVTPEGNEVVVSTSPRGCNAALEIEGTRLRLECLNVDDDAIARYFDSLEPIAPGDIDFSEPRLSDFF